MNRIKLLITTLLLSSLNLFSQNSYLEYYELTDSAQVLKRKGEYESAIEIFEKAFDKKESLAQDLIQLGDCYLKIGNYEKALLCLNSSIEKGTPLRYLERLRGENENNNELEFWKGITKNYPSHRKVFFENVDMETYIELRNIKYSDQIIREYMMSDLDKLKDESLTEYLKTTDLLNINKLFEIVESIGGFPGNKSFGDAAGGSYYVLLHLNSLNYEEEDKYLKIRESLIDIAMQGLKDGELTPFQFAHWIDKEMTQREGKMYYAVGSEKLLEKYPIKDLGNLDIRRKEIGLPPLKTILERKNLPVPAWYSEIK